MASNGRVPNGRRGACTRKARTRSNLGAVPAVQVVESRSLNGDIDFSGVLRTGGEYRLTTHDGDVSFEVRADAAATFSVATYNGEFETEVPVQLQSLEQGREFEFELGGGGARVSLQAFNGAIRLLEER